MARSGWTVRRWMFAVALAGLYLGWIVSGSQRTNCGGNRAAVDRIGCYQEIIERAAGTAKGPVTVEFLLRTASTDPDDRDTLKSMCLGVLLGQARYLVAREPFRADPKNPLGIIVVCDRPFQNVPFRTIDLWPNPPTHAAGFTDGSTRLISVEEFATLDRTRFTYLDDVLAGIGLKPATEPVR